MAASRSNLAILIYVAVAVEEGANVSATTNVHILIFDQNLLENGSRHSYAGQPDRRCRNPGRIGRLTVDDSLYALAPDGRLLRWSSNSIRDWVAGTGSEPTPIVQDLRNAASDPQYGHGQARRHDHQLRRSWTAVVVPTLRRRALSC